MAAVKLNIYDVTTNGAIRGVNKLFRVIGTGAFHSGLEVYGQEWSYGFSETGDTGVFPCPPRGCEVHAYRESLELGTTELSEAEVLQLVEQLEPAWLGGDYDLLRKNCCSFTNEMSERLGTGPIPAWVKNLAGAGATLNDGFARVGDAAHRQAIVAAAKAGEIDKKYGVASTVESNARAILTKAGELDGKLKIVETTRGVASKAAEGFQSILTKGGEARREAAAAAGGHAAAVAQEGYKFGDFTRGVVNTFQQKK
eukprot:TRINITY_DN72306_c0_g1_i1.p1 TRINITY_DN72306_c0_g1~~TRINITY_DN72306_c0_g1_i1.p1  ORF type:complete len:267 (+),score=69.99 TRINITY_DN72306_c0_g1_i1:38-802(+)